MMWQIAEQVRAAAIKLRVPVTALAREEASKIRERVFERYTESDRRGALWERLRDVVSAQDADAWKWLGAYAGDDRGVLFFNAEDEPEMFEFEHCRDIVSVLAECTGFEVYVTDKELSSVLCFNHHDFLIAAGDARAWLSARSTEHR
jgi:hypothetical protein